MYEGDSAARAWAVTVEWRNELETAFLPNDATLMGAVPPGEAVPIVTHLHGGENLPQFDWTPLQWFTRAGETGPHYISNRCTYFNEQRASMVWYHDHALGNTRTNVYARLAGADVIRDEQDTGETDNPLGLPAGSYELPLVRQDKTFNADGSLFYPPQGLTTEHPVWVPEFFGDVAVVNAKIWSFLEVEPRRYRLRLVSETLDPPVGGVPIHLNVEDGPYLDEETHLPEVTTRPAAGTVEDWVLVNTTADTHPIHLHLVTFEVLDRRPFDVAAYDPATQSITYTGPAVPAAPNENGRKDTVMAHPGAGHAHPGPLSSSRTRVRSCSRPASATRSTSGTATSSSTRRTT